MEYKTKTEGDCAIITLTGEIDLQTSPVARQQILETLQKGCHVLLEMSSVEYIDSSGIASLVEGYQHAKSQDLTFGLVNISKATRQVMELARLDQIFPIFSTIDEGIAAVKT